MSIRYGHSWHDSGVQLEVPTLILVPGTHEKGTLMYGNLHVFATEAPRKPSQSIIVPLCVFPTSSV